MQQIDLIASEAHYADHLLPIWEKMPQESKGNAFFGEECRRRAQRSTNVSLVGGYSDVQHAPIQPFILVEHGAGQSYLGNGADAFYSGGRGHNNAVGFICPNQEVADRWTARYPDKPTAVVGCPRLDSWHAGDRGQPEDRTVAITFHWDALFTGVPETSSAFYWYHESLVDLIAAWKRSGWTVLGHWHPRYPAVGQFWETLNRQVGVEVVPSAADVLDRASILVADNTSMQAEFLSLGRRVVWLNHPGYRREFEHGGRFWTWPTLGGCQIDTPESLALLDLESIPATVGHPYAFADGHAAERAVTAILSWLS